MAGRKTKSTRNREGRQPEPLVAVVPRWKDGFKPWCGSGQSPLLTLSLELLNMGFGLESGLNFRDWLALAGRSTALSEAFSDDAWRTIYYFFLRDIAAGVPVVPYQVEENDALDRLCDSRPRELQVAGRILKQNIDVSD